MEKGDFSMEKETIVSGGDYGKEIIELATKLLLSKEKSKKSYLKFVHDMNYYEWEKLHIFDKAIKNIIIETNGWSAEEKLYPNDFNWNSMSQEQKALFIIDFLGKSCRECCKKYNNTIDIDLDNETTQKLDQALKDNDYDTYYKIFDEANKDIEDNFMNRKIVHYTDEDYNKIEEGIAGNIQIAIKMTSILGELIDGIPEESTESLKKALLEFKPFVILNKSDDDNYMILLKAIEDAKIEISKNEFLKAYKILDAGIKGEKIKVEPKHHLPVVGKHWR